jgi:hypothetical protein
MKTTKQKIILFLILTLPILFLSACSDLSDADWELLEVAFESWAEENGLLENDQWQPDGVVIKAVEKTIGDFNNQKEFVELDGLDVVRDIEKADDLAADAMMENDLNKMKSAIELRPNDWRLREQNAIIWNKGFPPNLDNIFVDSDNIIMEQIQQGGDCVKLRTQQLEYRETLLSDFLIDCSKKSDCNASNLVFELENVQEKLYHIYDGDPIAVCEKFN